MRIARTQIPSSLFHEFYSPFLWSIGIAWFLYEISATGLSLYITAEIRILNGNVTPDLRRTFGWLCLIDLLRVLGSALGMYFTAKRRWGPKKTLVFGTAQEFGAGSNMALLAVTSCAPSVRGRFLGFAAALSKIGSIAGDTLIYLMYEYLDAKNMGQPDSTFEEALTWPFAIATTLLLLATILAYYGVPEILSNPDHNPLLTLLHLRMQNMQDIKPRSRGGSMRDVVSSGEDTMPPRQPGTEDHPPPEV
ncbi:hypothetical protein D6C80_03931 [Aureobasidium pullulans]|nr:hypothetical protein D6C80_03931 [Aureobasidium pullulans]